MKNKLLFLVLDLLLLSLSAVAVGQSTSAASKAGDNQKESSAHWIVATHPPPCVKGESIVADKRKGSKGTYCMLTATQPKPSVKPDPRDGQCFGWRDGKEHPETLHIEGSGDPIPKGTMWYPITFADPCDGISCVGPVEMLPGKKCDDCTAAVPHSYSDWPSDKAAVPVELAVWNVEPLNPFRTQTSQWANGAVVTATGTEIVALLPKEEYEHLQSLRAAVVEEEKRLAFKYGACVPYPWYPKPDPSSMDASGGDDDPVRCNIGDHYEFHGQFLLIDKGGK